MHSSTPFLALNVDVKSDALVTIFQVWGKSQENFKDAGLDVADSLNDNRLHILDFLISMKKQTHIYLSPCALSFPLLAVKCIPNYFLYRNS